MSTLPGQASKVEKTKSKFQSLDINSLYRVSRGENLEKQQQKSSLTHVKHGMQSLGKVPNARRAPANLPSLKSEHIGSDTAVPLIPPGASGWGKQESTTTVSSSSPTTPPNTTTISATPHVTSHQTVTPISGTTVAPQTTKQSITSVSPAATDKLWSSVMGGTDPLHPPPYQSPQFQHEFPSLSSGDGAPIRTGIDVPYPSGLSLRPQTEGSWIQGGARPGAEALPRSNSAPLGAPPQLPAQVGLPQPPIPSQFQRVMPPFMYKGSFQQANTTGNQNNTLVSNGQNRPPRMTETEEVVPRPIIKEEELIRMDEIGTDMGWAGQDDIDYNQKLAFSDEESEKNNRKEHKPSNDQTDQHNDSHPKDRSWVPMRSIQRAAEEEEMWMQRRNLQDREVEKAVQRAKQRKEEEEKRFNEATKQGAAKKLLELEEKIHKRDKDHDNVGPPSNTNNISTKPNHTENISSDLQRDKDNDNKPNRPQPDTLDERSSSSRENSFRHLTQIEGKSFPRKHSKPSERDSRERDRDFREPSFSKHFQNDLPPRFLKNQRNNTNPNLFDSKKLSNSNTAMKSQPNISNVNKPSKFDMPEKKIEEDRLEFNKSQKTDKFQNIPHRLSHEEKSKTIDGTSSNEFNLGRHDYKKDSTNWQKPKAKLDQKDSYQPEQHNQHIIQEISDQNPGYLNETIQDRYETIQRPDSRDSKTSRESRHSVESVKDSKDYLSWNDSSFNQGYEEKSKDSLKEEYRPVPGPITKDRIEADDFKSEKRHLTQLKKGQIPEKKRNDFKKNDKTTEDISDSDVKNNQSTNLSSNESYVDRHKIQQNSDKLEQVNDNEEKLNMEHKDYDNNSSLQSNNTLSNNNDYQRSWPKRSSNRNIKSNTVQRPVSGNFQRTDSDDSIDEISKDNFKDQASHINVKSKKNEVSEKNINEKQLDRRSEKNYIPRGEPSRHGRGGGNIRPNNRLVGLSKRIDGYGPPPSKSPFGHVEEKDKRTCDDNSISGLDEKNKYAMETLHSGGNYKDSLDNRLYSDRGIDEKHEKRSIKNNDRRRRSRSKNDFEKNEEDNGNTYSDNSDDKDRSLRKQRTNKPLGNANMKRNNVSSNLHGVIEKPYKQGRNDSTISSANYGLHIQKPENDTNMLCSGIADMSVKVKDKSESSDVKDDNTSSNGDTEGFQEVKSKKIGKDKHKSNEDIKYPMKPFSKNDKDYSKIDRKNKPVPNTLLTRQQIQNIPSLMATPVNPPPVLPQGKNQFERPRQNKLAPRFAKQKLQKAQMQQQQHSLCEMNDLGKVNPNLNRYAKDNANCMVPVSNAWEKPLGSQLHDIGHETMLGVSVDPSKMDYNKSTLQNKSEADKVISNPNLKDQTALLDGSTPPVNTIIFENTNFKSVPNSRNTRSDKSKTKIESGSEVDSTVLSGFNKPVTDILNKNEKQSDSMQLPLFKEDNADMKLDFFGSDLSHLTDEKSSKGLCISKTVTTANSTICTTDSLNIKIASVKKVWETHSDSNVGQDESNSFSNTFSADPNGLDSNVFNKGTDTPDDVQEGYSPSPSHSSSISTNVCKVKPTQQVSGSSGQNVLNSSTHQHSSIVQSSLMGNPLSPPPMQPVIGTGVNIGQTPQQYTANQHIGYQAGLGANTQYGISAVPSPPTVPTVLYNSTQQLQAQTGLYGAFQLEQAGVLGAQGRSQYSQYPNHYNLGQTASSPYSTQSVYLQTAPPHPPPAAQAPPELYPNMTNYRLSATTPFGQNQQLNNPTTVLISSTSNSLMSASVKPSNQQISAIGTKAGGVGQAYQQQSQQGQVFMYDPTLQANYLPNAGVMQRGPGGPVQNSVVQALQPSSSYYSGSTGGQTGYFQQPGNSTLQSAPLQHQGGYGLQGNVFGSHNQSHTNTAVPSFNSHYLSPQMQVAAAAALTAQQYRSGLPATYIKSHTGVGNQQISDQINRPQQMKSPGSQEVLSSVFNSGIKIGNSRKNFNRQSGSQ